MTSKTRKKHYDTPLMRYYYYTDYIPVDSAQEAEQLNELYGGWAIEKKWNGKKVFVSNGHVTPNYR